MRLGGSIRNRMLPPGRATHVEGHRLPYVSVDDLPQPIRAHLPLHAQEIYLSAFNKAWTEYEARGPERETIAHRVAWAAVKRKYQKYGDQWIPRELD
jgi:cation transport regulator